MVTLTFLFWVFVALFAIIGGMRGWAKELLVSFSVILGSFILTVLYRYVPFVQNFVSAGETSKFWMFSIVLVLITFFGYQTPQLSRFERFQEALRRDKFQDILLGIFLGAINGYLIVGSLWLYLHEANYFPAFIFPPETEQAAQLIAILPPVWLQPPLVYFAVAIAFAFVVIVFI